MFFGLTITPATLESYILPEKLNVFVIVYLVDILICIESELKKHVKAI